MREDGLDPIPDGMVAECDRCDARFFDLPSFTAHWGAHHSQDPSYTPVAKDG